MISIDMTAENDFHNLAKLLVDDYIERQGAELSSSEKGAKMLEFLEGLYKKANVIEVLYTHNDKIPIGFAQKIQKDLLVTTGGTKMFYSDSHIITRGFVTPKSRNKGVMSEMLYRFEFSAKNKGIEFLYTKAHTEAWADFFKKRGYRTIGECCSCDKYESCKCSEVDVLGMRCRM